MISSGRMLFFVVLAGASLIACADPEVPEVEPPGTDRGVDGAALDLMPEAGPPVDRGVTPDGRPTPDARPESDARPRPDLGVEPDMAPPPDDPCLDVADGNWCGTDLRGADHQSTYICSGGRTVMTTPCPAGCAGGTCVDRPRDPCQSAPGDGVWCGGTLTDGDPDALYTCRGGETADLQLCDHGCRVAPPGTPDGCGVFENPCAGTEGADGAYCGRAIGAEDEDALYICRRGATVEARPCVNGCESMPQGTADVCRAGDDPCAGAAAGNGLYCGRSLGTGDADTLYDCAGGATVAADPCPAGCQAMPAGTPDACAPDRPDPPVDPCVGADAGDGAYCGRTLAAGDPDTLYDCRGQVTRSAAPCPGGCEQMPPGTPDACRVQGDPCAAANAGNGLYCGRSLGQGDGDTLYDCQNRTTASAQPCPAGCEAMPPGTPDACRAVDDPCAGADGGDGDYCGRSLGAGDVDTLYTCRGRAVAAAAPCPDGCEQMPAGMSDGCRRVEAGDPCAAAAAGDGAYCGRSLAAGEPDTLYACRAGEVDGATPCIEGCRSNPPGVPDQCRRGDGACCLDRPPGALTQRFSACGQGGQHHGIDYGTRVGTPIHAGMAGTVVASRLGLPNCYDNGCTPACWNAFNYVKLRADCGDPNRPDQDLLIWYLHIEDLAPGVVNGTHVEQGQLLAFSGNSGCSSGPHIHIETATVARGADTALNTCASSDPAGRYCE